MLNPLAQLEGHEVVHKRSAFGRADIPDVDWINGFGKNKDAAFLTCDVKILKRPAEIAAFQKSNMTGFWLKSKSWRQYIKRGRFHNLAGKLILRWPILVQAAEVATGQAYEIPLSGNRLKGLP